MAKLAGDTDINIGAMITQVISAKKISKADLGRMLGIAGPAVTYLTTRNTIDVNTLHKVSCVLKHNFFKHYAVEEDTSTMLSAGASAALSTSGAKDERDRTIDELKNKNAEQEKVIEGLKVEMQKQENGFLREINELLKKK